MNIQFLPLLSAIFVFLLGFFVFLKNKKSKVNLVFFLFSVSICIWLFGTFMMFISDTVEKAFFWDKFCYVGVVFIPAFFYHFGVIFIKIENKKRKIILLGYLLSFIFLILNIATPFFINGVYKYSWGFHSKAQLFHHIFLLFFIAYFFLLFKELFKFCKYAKGFAREQAKYMLISLLVISSGSFAFLPAYGISVYPFIYVSGVLFTIILAYTIIRHRVLDIKFVLRKSSVYLASLSTILIFAILAQYGFYRFFMEISAWTDFVVLILAISTFPIINKYYYRLANKYFFTSLYDSQKVIINLSDKLRSTLELNKIYKFISNTFFNSFHVKAVSVLLYDKKQDSYTIEYNKGFDLGKRRKFSTLNQLRKMSAVQGDSIIIEELRHTSYRKYKETINTLDSIEAEVLTPLNIKDKNIGFIALGAKESKDIYNNEDLQVLKIIGAQSAIAIENAHLYKETKQFNIKLKKEVKRATAELRSANATLKKLDVAKSDFISIASHQLRTPLTIIKGYVSMLLEGTFGELNQKEADPLKKVYQSNERLIQLVENLLNISRIESGRLQFDLKIDSLERIAGSVVEELSNSARKKGLKLNYKGPAKPLPKVKIDESKIRQVILNLVDNAIKYTQKGSVNVSLETIKKNIQFCVSDTGMGISEEDMSRLFKRFSRGKDVSLVYANGSGLGLYVSKIMAEAHHGKIWCENKVDGQGAKFYFTIPIASHNA